MARYFLIPMQAPANGTGRGTRTDPWRPKYLKELGLSYSIRNARDFCLADVWGDDKALDELASMPDVEEVKDSDEALPPEKLTRVATASKDIPLARTATERELLASLRQAIHDKQVASRVQSVDDAVRGAIRAGN